MKWKHLLFLPFIICGYAFLPVSFSFNKGLNKPNTLLIRHQECGCPCPDASIIGGQIIIPPEISSKYSSLDRNQINLSGNDPFSPYNFELALQEIIVTGQVIETDTTLCDPTACEVVPVFKVEKWTTKNYYPRLWSQGNFFLILFLISSLLCILICLNFIRIIGKRFFTQSSG